MRSRLKIVGVVSIIAFSTYFNTTIVDKQNSENGITLAMLPKAQAYGECDDDPASNYCDCTYFCYHMGECFYSGGELICTDFYGECIPICEQV